MISAWKSPMIYQEKGLSDSQRILAVIMFTFLCPLKCLSSLSSRSARLVSIGRSKRLQIYCLSRKKKSRADEVQESKATIILNACIPGPHYLLYGTAFICLCVLCRAIQSEGRFNKYETMSFTNQCYQTTP